jgi:hypothetical protein
MKKINQAGAVSLISVMIFSLIIVIVATAFIANIAQQQREATNYDLKTRAGYAAEIGVQDAVRKLNAQGGALTNQTTCDPGPDGTVDNRINLSYTCQLINVEPGELVGKVIPNNRTSTVPINPNTNETGPYRLRVSWSIPYIDTTLKLNVKYPRQDRAKTFKTLAAWHFNNDGPGGTSQPTHPMLRVNIISHPLSPPLSRSNINQSVLIFNPTATPDSSWPTIYDDNSKSTQDRTQLITNGSCRVSGGEADADYSCTAEVILAGGANGFNLSNTTGTDKLYIHVGAYYAPTSWKVEFGKADFVPGGLRKFTLKNSQAAIDVTGKAGNVYHRVKQTLPIASSELLGSDSTLTVGDGICKIYLLTTQTTSYLPRSNVCDPDNPQF